MLHGAHLQFGEREATIDVDHATGRLAPLTIRTTGRALVADDAGSTVQLHDATYGDDAIVRTNKPSTVHASSGAVASRYQAAAATWDPIAGRINLNQVEASYALADATLTVTAERLDVDDLWQRAVFHRATGSLGACARLIITNPQGGGVFDGGVECLTE